MFKIKVIIIGDPGVGKTSLVKRYVSDYFSEDYKSSIGTNIFTKKIILNSNRELLFQIWDIAGQERWLKMRELYYRGSHGALVVGDLTRKNTFKQIIGFWIPDLKKNCTNIPFILIANKNDLKSDFSRIEIEEIGKSISANSTFYTSAKNGEHVEDAFQLISKLALKT